MAVSSRADFQFAVGPYSERDLRVVRFVGSEGISEQFRFDIELASEDHALDFEQVVGKPALLTIVHADGERYVSGIVCSFEQGARGVKFTRYHAVLVPSVWLLSQAAKCHIFQEASTRDIIEAVLKARRIPADRFRFSLRGAYGPRNYCVQYRETDFDFIARLMEEEGIFYFFEHGSDGETLVMGDARESHVPIAGNPDLPFRASAMAATEEAVREFHFGQHVRPTKVALRDYDFRKPQLHLQAEAAADEDRGLEVYDYPGEYGKQDLGKRLVQMRLEEIQCTRRAASGESDCRRFAPGYRFNLVGHSRSDLDTEYLITRVLHSGSQAHGLGEEFAAGADQAPVYHNQFECIPSDVPFRPARTTRRPVIAGVQTAIVVGPSGEEIYCDEHGRVKVRFHWDRDGKGDEKSSCWIRVSSAWAGSGYGGLMLPRVGQEVVVDFIEGDPDRPLITGRVYNGDNPVPYKLPDEKNRTTIKTNSVGADGSNEIRLDDTGGSEEFFVHAQKDQNLVIENDRTKMVRHDQTEAVGHDKKISVAGSHVEQVDGDMDVTVGTNLTQMVAVNHAATVGGAMELIVGGIMALSAGGALAEVIGGAKTSTVGGSSSESVTGSKSLNAGGALSETVGKDRTVTIGKDLKTAIGGKHDESVQNEYILNAKKVQIVAEDEIVVKSGSASVTLKKNGDISLKGNKIKIESSGDVIVKGSRIVEN